jgi:hypothetical protein
MGRSGTGGDGARTASAVSGEMWLLLLLTKLAKILWGGPAVVEAGWGPGAAVVGAG